MKHLRRPPHPQRKRWTALFAASAVTVGLVAVGVQVASADPLVEDGVYGWGTTSNGPLEAEQFELEFDNAQAPFVDIAAFGGVGDVATLAVTEDGDVIAQGDSGGVVAAMPASLADQHVIAVDVYESAGTYAAAITEAKTIVVWNGTRQPSQACRTRVTAQGAVDVQIGKGSSTTEDRGVVLLGDGTVCAWGPSAFVNDAPTGNQFVKISVTGVGALALTAGGDVVEWRGGQPSRVTPEVAAANIVDIASWTQTLWALTDSGELLRFGATTSTPFPAENDAAGKIIALSESTGSDRAVAVTDRGEFIPWGHSDGLNQVMKAPASLKGYEVRAVSSAQTHHAFIVGEQLEDVGPDPITATAPPSIAGGTTVGETLTATPATFSATDDVTLTHQWYATAPGGDPVLLGDESEDELMLAPEHVGSTITYTTTAQRGDEAPVVSASSNAVGPIVEAPLEDLEITEEPSLALAGGAEEPRVGTTIEATPAEFSPATGVTVEHRWFADGEPIEGVDTSTYTLRAEDLGVEAITYQSYGSRADGQTATSQVSNAIGPVLPVALEFAGPTAIDGPGYIGEELSVLAATTNDDEKVTNTFEWTVTFDDDRDDVVVDAATFMPAEEHRGGTITVTQTATRGESDSISQTSEPVGPVDDVPGPITAVTPADIALDEGVEYPFVGETVVGTPAVFDKTEGVTVKNFFIINFAEEVPAEVGADGKARLTIAPEYANGLITFKSVATRDGAPEPAGESMSANLIFGIVERLAITTPEIGIDRPWVGQELWIDVPSEHNEGPLQQTQPIHRWVAIAADGSEEIVGTEATLLLTEDLLGKRIVLEAEHSRAQSNETVTARSAPVGPVIEEPGPITAITPAEIALEEGADYPFVGETVVGTPAVFDKTEGVTVKNFFVINFGEEVPAEVGADGKARLTIAPEYANGLITFKSVATHDGFTEPSGESMSPGFIFGIVERLAITEPVIGGGETPWPGQELWIDVPSEHNEGVLQNTQPTHTWIAISEDGTEEVVSTDATLLLTDALLTKQIVLEAEHSRESTNETVTKRSAPVGPVRLETDLQLANQPTLAGTSIVGNELTATPATFNQAEGVTLEHRWFSGGERVNGANGTTFTLRDSDAGKVVGYQTVATRARDGMVVESTVVESGPVLVVLAPTVYPTISGTARVDEVLTVGTEAEFTDEVGVDITYAWFIGEEQIGAGASLPVTDAHVGQQIVLVAQATRGSETISAQSQPTAPVAKRPLAATSAPVITGAPEVGKTLTGTPATFNDTEAVAIGHQWLADGEAIEGANSTTLAVTEDLLGAKITFVSTAVRGSETPVVSESAETIPVLPEGTTPPAGEIEIDLDGPTSPGATITVQVGPALAGQELQVYLSNLDRLLAPTTVAPDGTIQVLVPGDIPLGTHRLAVYAENNLIGWDDFEVTLVRPEDPAFKDLIDVSPDPVKPGGELTIQVGADRNGQPVRVVMFSTPRDLGFVTVAADGTVRVVVPADMAPGVHRVAVYDANGALIGWQDVTVGAGGAGGSGSGAGTLPRTGAGDVGPMIPLGLTFLVAGLGLLAYRSGGRRQLS